MQETMHLINASLQMVLELMNLYFEDLSKNEQNNEQLKVQKTIVLFTSLQLSLK